MTATKTRSSNCYDIAKDLVSQGHSVIRLENRGKKPVDPGWQKRNGNAVASTMEDVARLWQQGQAKNNVGIVIPPGLFVLDIDGAEGATQLGRLETQYGKLPRTRKVQSTSGTGHHLYFKYDPSRHRITNSRIDLANALNLKASVSKKDDKRDLLKIDVRGIGGQVVAPGMTVRYPDGREGTSMLLIDAPIADAPSWLVDLLALSVDQQPFEVGDKPVDDQTLRELEIALRFVACSDYDGWIRVGMALHTTGRGEEVFALFVAWSETQYERHWSE